LLASVHQEGSERQEVNESSVSKDKNAVLMLVKVLESCFPPDRRSCHWAQNQRNFHRAQPLPIREPTWALDLVSCLDRCPHQLPTSRLRLRPTTGSI
jgi:hypothetical protein